MAEEGKVSKLYEKINQQVKSLTDSLSAAGKQDTPLYQAADNVSQNINFMNEVNQTFNYVQIPLKMENGEKAGELYVYSNKKSLAEKEGNVTALLHLDMEYLGPLDVHVALQDYTKVRTQFFLKDESALDLIAEHIDMLNERLNNRGYSMSAEFINKDEHKDLIDNLTEQSGAVPVYSQTTLDVRA
ncbi:MAG: flagellar hook-length control protein FliK [Lachnospiraceae bacterium]|nr:flagellar hook-length control protein FliK [Lachnospiraceae bacterium]